MVLAVRSSGVGSLWTIYGTQWCASNHQFAYRKGLGTRDALLCISHTLQSALESEQEARIVQINFSAAFDRVNHKGFLYKLCSVVLEVLCCLCSHSFCQIDHCTLWWMGCRSKLVNVMSGVRQGSVWTNYCSSCTLRRFFPFWKIS